ncbi:LacI family DNA-binding transcriptional regulator [Streptococcus cameli]
MVATIKDIARETGVSTATVSRVLNNLGGYSSAVEEKVLSVAKALHYHKNENARSLVQKNSKTIGIILPHVTTSFYEKIVKGIEDQAYQNNYSVIITHAGIDGDRALESIQLMAERRVDGVIIFSMPIEKENAQNLLQLGIPVLLIATEAPESGLPHLKVDDYAASYAAVDYLISEGHTRIAYIGASPIDRIAGQPRIKGYRDALHNHALVEEVGDFQAGDFSFESGQQAMEELLTIQSNVTAIACASDEVAMGALSVCYKHHIRIPEDLSIMGYDDSGIASMATPPLTTVAQPFYEMGQEGCQAIIESIESDKVMVSRLIPFEIIKRESIKKKEK